MSSEFSLTPELTESDLIEFDVFTVYDESAVNTLIPLGNLEASTEIINLALQTRGWKGYQYETETGTVIGYGTKNITLLGLTEQESYSEFIAEWKEKERKFKRNMPLPSLSQTQYDALLSLYFFTGDFLNIGKGTFKLNIGDYIKNRQWNYVATAMIKTNFQRSTRRYEANILMFADYGKQKSRDDIKQNGLQDIRKRYPELMDQEQKRQAEVVYFMETQRFLPKMSQSRMREIVKIVEQNN